MVIHHVWHWILQVLGKTFPCFRKDKGKNLLWGILMQWQLVTEKEVIEHRIKRDLQDHQVQYQNFYTGKKMTLWFKSSMSDLWIPIQWIPESALLWALCMTEIQQMLADLYCVSVSRSSRRLLNTHTRRSIQGSWCSALAKGKFVSEDWNFKVRNAKKRNH